MAIRAIDSVRETPDSILRAQYDHRACWQKVAHMVASLVREVIYWLAIIYHWIFGPNPQQCGLPVQWNPDSQGLVVMLHGLRASPAAWHSQLALLDEHPEVDVFAPIVPQKGMCSLEDAARPILPTVLDYAQRNPERPICLLGVSNGSRIVTWLETHLRQSAPRTPVMVSTIAGVHFGSSRMNLLESAGLGAWFYPAVLGQELQYGSQKARELLNQVIAPLPHGCAARSYEFYATTEDLSVPDLDSSLPTLNKGETFHVVHGHSHDSIVPAVAEQQIDSCLQWIGQFEE